MRFWKRTLLCTSILVAIGGTVLISARRAPRASGPARETSPRPGESPGRDVRRISWSLGVVRPNQVAEKSIEIKNDSDRDWTFQRVHTSCGCTVGEVSPKVIAPRTTGRIAVKFTAPGVVTDIGKEIDVRFSELHAPVFRVLIEAKVRDALTLTPSALRLVPPRRGGSVSEVFDLYNYSGKPLEITRVESPPGNQVVLKKTSEHADHQRFAFQVTANCAALEPGDHVDTIVIHTASPDLGPARLPIEVSVPTAVEYTPRQLFFRPASPGEPERSFVMVRLLPEVGQATGSYSSSHDLGKELEVRLKPNGQILMVEAEFAPQTSGKLVKGTLQLIPSRQDLPTIRLPILARAK